jgi:quercetin dioxygenase-like cupin family protein
MRFIRVVFIGVIGFALACGGAETAEDAADAMSAGDAPDAVTADPDHYSVEFENDVVRIVRVRYGPGETSTMHNHPPLCSITLSPTGWEMTNADGTVEENAGAPGDVECGTEAAVHIPRNTSDGTNEAILVEIQEGAMAASDWMVEEPHAVEADPDHYTVVAETDVVRMVRVVYGAGETSVMHHHPAHCVVWLQPGPVTFELPSGETVDAPADEAGGIICNDGAVHLPTNTGDAETEVVLIELKGRAAFGG